MKKLSEEELAELQLREPKVHEMLKSLLEEVKWYVDKSTNLKRGCSCEYDYRCGTCDDIVSMQNRAHKWGQ